MKSGIYMITCIKNGNRYIGSSKNIKKRIYNHLVLLRKKSHHNSHMQNIWNKYGEESFCFSILEEVLEESALIDREQFWIDFLNPEINKAIKAQSGFLGKKHTTETKKRLSDIQKKRMESSGLRDRLRQAARSQNINQPNAMKGKKLSYERKQKLKVAAQKQFSDKESRRIHSEAMKKWMTPQMKIQISIAKTGVKQSESAKENHRKAMKKVWERYSPEQMKSRKEKTAIAVIAVRAKRYQGFLSPDGKEYRDIYNLSNFCREHNLSHQKMSLVANGKILHYKGWKTIKS